MGTPFSPPTTRDREVFTTTELLGLLPPDALHTFTLIPRPPKEDAPLSHRTTSYLTLAVPDPKHLNAVLSYLAHALPLPARHSHLRRVRQQPSPPRVLLCPQMEGWRAAGLKEAPAQLSPLALLLECAVEGSVLARLRVLLAAPTLTLECHPVVTTPPRGREECNQESGALWPMCYRLPQGSAAEDAQEAAGVLGVEEVAYFSRGMALALQQAAQGEALGYEPQGAALCLPSSSSSYSSSSSQQGDGADSGSAGGGGGGRDGIDMVVRGVGFSKTHLLTTADTGIGGAATTASCPPRDHPFASSVMEAIECVAKGDREREGGVRGGGEEGGGEDAQGVLQPRRMDLPEDRLVSSLSKGGGAAGLVGGGVEREGAPIVARKKRPRSGDGGGSTGGDGVGTEGDSEEEKEDNNNCPSSPPTPFYICTGCDAFLTHEPSIGDAMALVHARVGRVVFLVGAKEGEGGLLGWGVNKVRLHGVKALNHHFNAYVAAAAASALGR